MSVHRTSYTMIISEYDDKWTVNGWDCSHLEFPNETEAKGHLIDLIKDIPNHRNAEHPMDRWRCAGCGSELVGPSSAITEDTGNCLQLHCVGCAWYKRGPEEEAVRDEAERSYASGTLSLRIYVNALRKRDQVARELEIGNTRAARFKK